VKSTIFSYNLFNHCLIKHYCRFLLFSTYAFYLFLSLLFSDSQHIYLQVLIAKNLDYIVPIITFFLQKEINWIRVYQIIKWKVKNHKIIRLKEHEKNVFSWKASWDISQRLREQEGKKAEKRNATFYRLFCGFRFSLPFPTFASSSFLDAAPRWKSFPSLKDACGISNDLGSHVRNCYAVSL